MPAFTLPNTHPDCGDATIAAFDYFIGATASLVLFTCNHCPYVKGSEKLLNQTIAEFLTQGLRVLAISANDSVAYPDDGKEKMSLKCIQEHLQYPYLFDQTQEVAKSFDAQCTPECFLFDKERRLVYQGALTDSPRSPEAVTANYLQRACAQLLAGSQVNPAEVKPLGCSIKWNFTK